jgi:hypothetical protein
MIAIVIFTHDKPAERVEYALRCFYSLQKLEASEELWFHLADDGSSQAFRDELMHHARERYGENTSVTNSEDRGYGASYNRSSQSTHSIADIILPLEDDWEVCREFNLDAFAQVLREGHFNCIRMGYLGYTDTLRSTFRYHHGLHYLELDPDSPEKHVFAGGPRLETREFQRTLGEWPEKLGAGSTELAVISRSASRQKIAWPMSIAPYGDVFLHIGSLKANDGTPGSKSTMEEVSAEILS